jgi:CheY-like chemotaxis protein
VVGQLAAGIAHDFNNILAVIVLYSQTLQTSANLSESEKRQLAVIDQQAKRASELVQQVLDFSRQSVMIAKPLDLLPLLKEEIKLLRRTLPEHITIKLRYTEKAFFVQADPTRLQQVVMNLALNARDAMPDGGQLLFEVSQVDVLNKKQAPLPQMDAGSWLQLRVTDTGSGINPTLLDHVFEPFFTTKSPGKGNGLGLAQVHGIVGQHGGQITVESQVYVGTTFTIYLPSFDVQAAETNDAVDTLDIPHGKGEWVLIVEDNEALREALTEGLTGWNYNVVAAADGVEALQLLETRSSEISLIISDMVMPRMGGPRLLHALNEKGWSIPVIFLTGHPNNDVEPVMLREGVVATMLKPLDMARLAQTMANVLTSKNSPFA